MSEPVIATRFVRWSGSRAFLHQGWWLVASLYLVVDAGLSPAQLVVIGAAQSVVALVAEVPAGALADTVSRKWSLVLSHLLMGSAMLLTGLVSSFAALAATQMLWGLSWCFASGADVAWVTDELDRPQRIAAVLTRSAQAKLVGSALGLVSLGLFAWATSRSTAIIAAGAAMVVLGLYVALGFPEHGFVRTRQKRWAASLVIVRQGLALVRRSREIQLMFAATVLVNGASDASGRLQPKQLLDIGFPTAPDPLVWFTALGVITLLVGAVALRIVGKRIDGVRARADYAGAAVLGAVGALLFALAPDPVSGSVGVLLVVGVAVPLTRLIGTVWVNARTTSDVRATVHSFLAQAEYLGEIACGGLIALLASLSSLPVALTGCATLFALTALLIGRRTRDAEPG